MCEINDTKRCDNKEFCAYRDARRGYRSSSLDIE
jgi:hypothetical protein